MNRNLLTGALAGQALLIGVGIFVAVVVAGFFLVKKPTSPTSTQGMPLPQSTTEEKVVTEDLSPAREITVTGTEYSYNPASIIAKKGEKIKLTFINAGATTHNLVIDALNVKTKMVAPGKSDTIEFTLESDTNLVFYCSVPNHRNLGMEGEIKLEQ